MPPKLDLYPMNDARPPWHFLINPAAGRGRAGRAWQRWLPELEAALPGMTWAESTAREGMAAIAEAAIRNGKTRIVGVGGDGTHHDIVNGIVTARGLEKVVYAPLPLGSGNDWVRTLGTPRRLENWINMLRQGRTIRHGVGWLDLSSKKKYFLNVAGMAYDAEVLRRVEAGRFKNKLAYPLVTMAGLPGYEAPTVRIEYDGNSWTGPVHTINLGIGRYSGGGMQLVPQANPEADTLALTFAEQFPVWRVIAESWRFYAGSIGRVKGVTLTTAKSVKITPLTGRLELEADGEWLGSGPVEAGLLAGKLRVVVP